MGGPNQQEGRPPPECCTRVRREEIVFGTVGYLKKCTCECHFPSIIKFKCELKQDSYIPSLKRLVIRLGNCHLPIHPSFCSSRGSG